MSWLCGKCQQPRGSVKAASCSCKQVCINCIWKCSSHYMTWHPEHLKYQTCKEHAVDACSNCKECNSSCCNKCTIDCNIGFARYGKCKSRFCNHDVRICANHENKEYCLDCGTICNGCGNIVVDDTYASWRKRSKCRDWYGEIDACLDCEAKMKHIVSDTLEVDDLASLVLGYIETEAIESRESQKRKREHTCASYSEHEDGRDKGKLWYIENKR